MASVNAFMFPLVVICFIALMCLSFQTSSSAGPRDLRHANPNVSERAGKTSATVNVVGDSITFLARHAIERAFASRYRYRISALPGATMAQQFPALLTMKQSLEAHGTPALASSDWIIELGTDDVGWFENRMTTDEQWHAEFDQEVQTLAEAHCVILVTVSTDPSALPGPIPDELDQLMWAQAASHPNFHVLDWGALEYTNSEWVTEDHIHPTSAGQTEFANLEMTALDHYCTGPPAPGASAPTAGRSG